MTSTDAELLAAARAGEREAIESLLERHQDRIYRFGLKVCGDPEDAQDVLQDTLIAMAKSVGDFREESSLSTWLYTIARNACRKRRRKSKFAPNTEESLETGASAEVRSIEASEARPDEFVERRELAAALQRAIDALDPDYREVLVLRDVEGLKAAEVGDVLNLSVAAVKSRLHRARLRVRESMIPILSEGEAETAPSDCPDVLTLYSKHVEGDISSTVCSEMERHLESCVRCRGACDSLKRTLSLCQSTPAVAVPLPVQASVRQALREFLAGE